MLRYIIAEVHPTTVCFSSESSAPDDNEGTAGGKSEEQQPVEREPQDTEVGGAKEEDAADTEKAKKLDGDSDEADKKESSGEGEAEKTEKTSEKGEDDSKEVKPSYSGEISDVQAGGNETVEDEADAMTESEKADAEAEGEKTDMAASEERIDTEDKGDGQEASTPEQQPSSAEPPVVSVEGGENKAEEPEKVAAATEAKKEEEEQEEEMVFDYDYEQLKSTPEMVNVTTSDMLTLLYPHDILA